MQHNHFQEKGNEFIFLGTGSSTGTPRIPCLIRSEKECPVCIQALQPGNKNKRRNPSAIIHYKGKNIMIDCGKTFRDSLINAVVITHGHADAFFGMDDLREVTELKKEKLPVYIRESDVNIIRNVFPYLFDTSKATGSGYVSQINFITFDPSKPLIIEGLEITPFVVEHGYNSTSLGFKFGSVAYISDVSKIPENVYTILGGEKELDILVLDLLSEKKDVGSHFDLSEALTETRKLKPKKTYFVGMGHTIEYYSLSEKLKKLLEEEQLDVELAYDGLRIPLTSI